MSHLTPGTRHLTPLFRALALAALTIPYSLFPVPSPAQTPTYNLGQTATQEQIRAWDISVSADGKGLPPGSGTAKEGADVYAKRCAQCHGANLEGEKPKPGRRPAKALVGGKGSISTEHPLRTVGSFWPFTTTLWDYINRAMPLFAEGSLSANEVYAVTAFVLYKNGIVQESDVMDAVSLPKVQMPNRNGFVPLRPEWKGRSGDPGRQR